MNVGNRGFLASVAVAACFVAGCGGGGGGGGSPVPPPTALPAVVSRPLAAGDTFAYAGTTTDAKTFFGTNPHGTSTTTSAVAQSIAVSGGATFNGLTGAFDFKTTETDTSPLQQIGITTDTFYASRASGFAGSTNLLTSGSTSSDTFGEQSSIALAGGNQLVDILPETSGSHWSGNGAETIATKEADGTSDTRAYAADGSYHDSTTYPQGSQFTPQPAPLTATIVENADGSGVYSLPIFGSSPNVTISFGTPNPAGDVPIVVGPGALETANPVAFYSPGPLYVEKNVTSMGHAIPTACNAGATFGTSANAIVQNAKRIDTILGTVETLAQTTYVVPKYGVACVQLTDTTNSYYDYSGQSNNGLVAIDFAGGPTPTEVDSITTTLGLTAATVQTMSLHAGRADDASPVGLRIANARSNFIATVERERIARKKRALTGLRAALLRAHPGLAGGLK